MSYLKYIISIEKKRNWIFILKEKHISCEKYYIISNYIKIYKIIIYVGLFVETIYPLSYIFIFIFKMCKHVTQTNIKVVLTESKQ